MYLLKKLSWTGIVSFVFLISCDNYDFNKMSGMWQLKSVQEANGSIQVVDTIFYSFQNNAFFSCTIVNPQTDFYESMVFYGYLDFPSEKKLHIELDSQYNDPGTLDLFPWKAIEVTYDIVKQTRNELVLKQDPTMYYFIRF
ncbi:hypothetical protein FACS1894162_0840 [Bacteroidia bacterium]|nr:hypothetical protein FACS1894162_0840 [Bacteroidia bacterium]